VQNQSKKISATWTLLDAMVVFSMSKCMSGEMFRILVRTDEELSGKYLESMIDKKCLKAILDAIGRIIISQPNLIR
jgi:hypothetical protein